MSTYIECSFDSTIISDVFTLSLIAIQLEFRSSKATIHRTRNTHRQIDLCENIITVLIDNTCLPIDEFLNCF